MERLDAGDAWFLYLETPTVHLHVTGVLLLDPTGVEGFGYERVRRHLEERLEVIPFLTRRLVEVPLGIDHPGWIEDPDFDLGRHVRHHRLGKRGSMADLATYVGRVAGRPLERDRPLWQMVFVDGLADGRVAIVTKLHHCLVDGVTGMGFMGLLLSLSPDGEPVVPADAPATAEAAGTRPGRSTERVPSAPRVVADAALSRLGAPLRPARAATRAAASLGRLAGAAVGRRSGGAEALARPLDAPRTMFNATLTARRSVAFGTLSLDDVKAVKRHFGVTVNDVVLAAVTYGLRRYLAARHDLPDRPLVCSVPVSVHGPHDHDDGSANRVSNMFVHLPVHLEDPVERLRSIHQGTVGAKELQAAIGSHLIEDVVDLIPSGLFHLGARVYSGARLADRLPPVHNLVVSNVPGSPVPLYFAGARLDGIYPLGPLMEGAALNITVLSNLGDLDVGIVACPDLVPRLGELTAGMAEGVAALLAATGAAAGGGGA